MIDVSFLPNEGSNSMASFYMYDHDRDLKNQGQMILPCFTRFIAFSSCLNNCNTDCHIALDKMLFFFNPKLLIFFSFLYKNICCGYSLEAPQRGAFNEYPQHIFVEI